jgi:hypothetical protein
MNDKQRLQLQSMIKTNNVVDQTELIRNLKHSAILRDEIRNMILVKAKYRDDPERLFTESAAECNFLFTYYTDIFNRIRKDEINLEIMNKFLDVLQNIEDGELDQHEGSFQVGTILKELYVDSVLKKEEKLEEIHGKGSEPKKPQIKLSWNQFKKTKI